MKVHRFFGPGFPEIIYKRALMVELKKLSIVFGTEVERDIVYEGQLIGKRRLDLIIDSKVLTELKVVPRIDFKDNNQLINYLRVFKMEVGLLLNFGLPSLFFKRFINSIGNNP